MALCIFRHGAVAYCIRASCFWVENLGGEEPFAVARHVEHTLRPHAGAPNCGIDRAWPGASQFALAGGAWFEPQGYSVPAAFKKNKRGGRNEYLRARLNLDGHCEVFPSEGSGRISSISWSDGLVVLGHDAVAVTPGVLVHYVPYRNYMRPS